MFGGSTSNFAWFQLGQWSAEKNNFGTQRKVADAQSYIRQLEAALQQSNAASAHNYAEGEQAQNEVARLKMLLAERDSVIKQLDGFAAHYQKALATANADGIKAQQPLDRLGYLTGVLRRAKKKEREGWPEYKELALIREKLIAILSEGSMDTREQFPEFDRQNHARYQFLIKSLSPEIFGPQST